jgi:two-component system sensor histidine kinase KdpD
VALLALLATTWLLRWWATRLHLSNVAMAYLVVILAVATTFGRGPALAASVLAFALFDVTFVQPVGRLTVSDPDQWLMLIAFLATGLTTGQLAGALRQRAQEARERAQDTHLLYELTSAMSSQVDLGVILSLTSRRVQEVFGAESCEFQLRDDRGELPDAGSGAREALSYRRGVAVLPLQAGELDFGVMRVGPRGDRGEYREKERRLLAAIADHVALAIERTRLTRELSEAHLLRESDALKSAILSAVSHDLRTPLAAIKAFATGLLEAGVPWDPDTVRESLTAIDEEADRLNRLVGNLLDVSRLQAGSLSLNRDWYSIEALIHETLRRSERLLERHPVTTDVSADLPAVSLDYPLVQQVLINLLDNAVKHTPAGTPIQITARQLPAEIQVSVSDRGPGIAASEREAVFGKFYRLEKSEHRRAGAGLGLAICRGFVEAHGGRIWIEESPGAGATVTFSLPVDGMEGRCGEEIDPRRG